MIKDYASFGCQQADAGSFRNSVCHFEDPSGTRNAKCDTSHEMSSSGGSHGNSQRKVMLNNSADCLASYRDSLRSNMNKVRKDITETFAQQVGILRARETELLRELQHVVNFQEAQLDTQQNDLHRLIRQYDTAHDKKRESTDYVHCLTHVDCNPKGCGTIYFDKDLVAFRTSIGNFGSIRFEPDNQGKKYNGETLPMSMEEYEDDIGMTHKSLHMLSHQPPCKASPEQIENIRKWLSYVPGREITQEDLYKMVPEERVDSEAETNSICSSFDIIPTIPQEETKSQCFNINWPNLSSTPTQDSSCNPTYEFTSEFLKTLNSDATKWLLGQGSSGNSSSYNGFVNITAAKYEFQNVMQKIHDSNSADWYLPSCSNPHNETSPQQEQDEEMRDAIQYDSYDQIDKALARNLEMLAIFSVRSGSAADNRHFPISQRDIDSATAGDRIAKKKLIAFGHHLWTVMHK